MSPIPFLIGVLAIIAIVACVWYRKLEQQDEDHSGVRDEEKADRDGLVKRNRFGRTAVCLLISVWVIAGPMIILATAYTVLQKSALVTFGADVFNEWLFDRLMVLGFCIGIYLHGYIIDKTTINIPVYTGAVLEEKISGNPVVYGNGLHAKYPTEEMHRDRHFSLRDSTFPFTQDISAKGSNIRYMGILRWKASLPGLETFYGKSVPSINQSLVAIMEGFFSSLVTNLTPHQAPNSMRVLTLVGHIVFKIGVHEEKQDFDKVKEEHGFTQPEKDLFDTLMNISTTDAKTKEKVVKATDELRNTEKKFGIVVLDARITDIELPGDVQRSIDALTEMRAILNVAMVSVGINVEDEKLALEEWKKLSPDQQKDALDRAAIVAGQRGITRQTFDFQGEVPDILRNFVGKTNPPPKGKK
ncbi:MAG: SPFH domain-containing protein [bacterium]|nr:SPFH domain-containing protein [bacterium]